MEIKRGMPELRSIDIAQFWIASFGTADRAANQMTPLPAFIDSLRETASPSQPSHIALYHLPERKSTYRRLVAFLSREGLGDSFFSFPQPLPEE